MIFIPLYSFVNFLGLRLLGMTRFDSPQEMRLFFQDKTFEVFRHIMIQKPAAPGRAVFWMRFALPASVSFESNKRASGLALYFFSGLPGFCEKYWRVNRADNEYLGAYEWASAQTASRYARSFAFRFMTSRAVKDSVRFGIEQDTKLEAFLAARRDENVKPS